jgi:hypothetical protein
LLLFAAQTQLNFSPLLWLLCPEFGPGLSAVAGIQVMCAAYEMFMALWSRRKASVLSALVHP